MKYSQWLEQWLNNYVRPIKKERTYKKYLKQVQNHISPQLGGYSLDELSAQVLQQLTVSLTDNGLATNTVKGVTSVLKLSIKCAAMLGITNVQCTDAIVCPKAKEKSIQSFSRNEQRKIEEYITKSNNGKLFGILLCLYTGLRIGELLALTWQDIDFSKGIISVTKTCSDSWQNGRYVKVVDSPKTDNSFRYIPIPAQLLSRLKQLRKKARGNYVVDGNTDYGVGVRSYQRTFENMLKNIGLPHKGFHSLRHTFATRALEVGVDVKTLSELLGHSNPTITLKRYAHSLLEHKTEMMKRLGKLMFVSQ